MLLLLVVESRLRQFVYFQGRLETSCKQKLVLSTSAKASIPSQVIVFARPSQNQRAPGIRAGDGEEVTRGLHPRVPLNHRYLAFGH